VAALVLVWACAGTGAAWASGSRLEAAPGASTATDGVPASDVALVGGAQVTKTEVEALMNEFRIVNESEHRAFPKPGTAAYKTFQDDAVNYFVEGVDLEQQARTQLGITITDRMVDAEIAKIREHSFGGSNAKMLKHFEGLGIDPAQLQSFERLSLAEAELPGILAAHAHLKVTRAQAHSYYIDNRIRYPRSSFSQAEPAIIKILTTQQTDVLVKSWIAKLVDSTCGEIRYQVGYRPSDLTCGST
jgi:hypothetical protein